MMARFALAVFGGAAIGGFAISHGASLAWIFELPCALSLFRRIERAPRRAELLAVYASRAVLAATLLFGLTLMAYPVFAPPTAQRLTVALGYALAFLTALFTVGAPVWSPERALFPVAIGLLVVACFNMEVQAGGFVALASAALFGYLALAGYASRAPEDAVGGRARQVIRLVFSTVGSAALAALIIRLLPWAQTKVEQATFNFFSHPGVEYSSLSNHSRLGDLEELKLSMRVVMRAWTTRPQKLRGRVFTEFDGESWRARPSSASSLLPLASDAPLDKIVADWAAQIPGQLFLIPGYRPAEAETESAVRTKIIQSVFNNGMVVTPAQSVLLRAPAEHVRADAAESVILNTPVEIYGVVNRRAGDLVQAGETAAEARSESLALPEDTDPRLKELAARLAAGARSPEEQVQRTVSFVETECRYALNVGRFKTRQPVAEFLFDKKQGYCQYFASAAAVLLRLQRIPARYVTGFNVQQGDFRAGHYVVREANAHAWIEAYLPGRGWVAADPTPEAEYEALQARLRSGWLAAAQEWLSAGIAEISVRIRGGDWLPSLRWLGTRLKALLRYVLVEKLPYTLLALALAALAAFARRWRRPRPAPAAAGSRSVARESPELADLLARLDRIWTRRGFSRPPWRAPLEHLDAIPADKLPPELRETSREAIECVYRACFAGQPPDPDRIRQLRRALSRAVG